MSKVTLIIQRYSGAKPSGDLDHLWFLGLVPLFLTTEGETSQVQAEPRLPVNEADQA